VRIEDQKYAPSGGEGEPAYELRQLALMRSAIEHDSTSRKSGDADPRTRAPAKASGYLLRIEAQAFQRGNRRADGESKLRSRSKPRMRRDRLLDAKVICLLDTAAVGDAPQVPLGARPLDPPHLEGLSWFER
jgi:hypothetical protein